MCCMYKMNELFVNFKKLCSWVYQCSSRKCRSHFCFVRFFFISEGFVDMRALSRNVHFLHISPVWWHRHRQDCFNLAHNYMQFCRERVHRWCPFPTPVPFLFVLSCNHMFKTCLSRHLLTMELQRWINWELIGAKNGTWHAGF